MAGYKGIGMNGVIAHWYAKTTAHDLGEYQALAQSVREVLSGEQNILEVAPGPGYLSLDLARDPKFRVTGLDISKTFVEIARAKAKERQVAAVFVEGNASAMPFADGTFDFVVCRAAFKNFSEPLQALNEMHRILREGGSALIVDLRKDVTSQDINAYVRNMHLTPLNALFTASGLKQLRQWAYRLDAIEELAEKSSFPTYQLEVAPMDFRLRLMK